MREAYSFDMLGSHRHAMCHSMLRVHEADFASARSALREWKQPSMNLVSFSNRKNGTNSFNDIVDKLLCFVNFFFCVCHDQTV